MHVACRLEPTNPGCEAPGSLAPSPLGRVAVRGIFQRRCPSPRPSPGREREPSFEGLRYFACTLNQLHTVGSW